MTKKNAVKKTTVQRLIALADIPDITKTLTGDSILRKALTDALNKTSILPGAVVQLSGGPKMTIEREILSTGASLALKDERKNSPKQFRCLWFDKDLLQVGFFRPEALQLAPK